MRYAIMVSMMHYAICLFSLHSLCRGGTTAAYWQGLDQINIKHQVLWTSNVFWQYIISSRTATSPLAAGLTRAIHNTASGMSTTASTSS